MLLLWQQAEKLPTVLEVELLLGMGPHLGMHQLVNQRELPMSMVPTELQILTEVLVGVEHQTRMPLVDAHQIPTHMPVLPRDTMALGDLDGVHQVFHHHHHPACPVHLLSPHLLEDQE